jgi:hypothetical protein
MTALFIVLWLMNTSKQLRAAGGGYSPSGCAAGLRSAGGGTRDA